MRIFATQNYRLAKLPWGARVFYSLFLFMVLLGLLSCLGFMWAKSGLSAAEISEYYRQKELGLGGKSFLELLETAHFHLFSMPIFFLVLGHIFFMSSWSEPSKLVVILSSFAALLLEIALPWLIVYHSDAWTPLVHVARGAMFATFLLFVFVPLKEMWTPERS
jgi:hypothetical protein